MLEVFQMPRTVFVVFVVVEWLTVLAESAFGVVVASDTVNLKVSMEMWFEKCLEKTEKN